MILHDFFLRGVFLTWVLSKHVLAQVLVASNQMRTLNTARERELIDKVVLLLGEHHNAAVLAFEHDGLFLYWPDEPEKLRGLIESALRCFRYTVKPMMPLREALQAAARVMRSGSPGLERMFDQVDSRWLGHHGILRQAFKGSYGLFGEVSSKIPYSLKDIFKFIVDTGHKAWFSATLKTWILTGDSAMDSLRKASEKILIRDLTDYHIEWTTSEQDARFRSSSLARLSRTALPTG